MGSRMFYKASRLRRPKQILKLYIQTTFAVKVSLFRGLFHSADYLLLSIFILINLVYSRNIFLIS